jgi:hypothetical protein
MADLGLCRTVVNRRLTRVKTMFSWAVSEELVHASISHGLREVKGFRNGEKCVRESEPVQPAFAEDMLAALPHCPAPVAAMVELQWLTGMRSGEVLIMRTLDIDQSNPACWLYRPGSDAGPNGLHKNAWRGQDRVVLLGPRFRQAFLDLKVSQEQVGAGHNHACYYCLPGQEPPRLEHCPGRSRVIDFLSHILADGQRHPKQEILAAAKAQRICESQLYAALPFVDIVREREPHGRVRCATWRLWSHGRAEATIMAGANNVTQPMAGYESKPRLNASDPWMDKMDEIHKDVRDMPRQTVHLLHQRNDELPAQINPTDERGRWLYEERTKAPPVPWKSIITELSRIAEERGWESLADEPAASTALRRWCMANKKEYPRP